MTKVVDITAEKDLPRTPKRVFVSAVTRLQAQAWGERKGYPVVYYWKKRNRAYAVITEGDVKK